MHFAINRSQPLRLSQSRDPFAAFWSRGFKAKMVSSSFSKKLEIVCQKEVLGHVARWELIKGKTVVLSLEKVRDSINFLFFFTEQPLVLSIQKAFQQLNRCTYCVVMKIYVQFLLLNSDPTLNSFLSLISIHSGNLFILSCNLMNDEIF